MATVNYSVPDEIKEAFNRAFYGENKSAIIAELMREAVARAAGKRKRARAIDRILALRKTVEPMTNREIKAARDEGRR
ncbi:MAG: hypothetical protein H0W33_07105 [Gammaproteobacteria bacterium]|nr:hypothetical protein [Gammaproteobacteria bacterium]